MFRFESEKEIQGVKIQFNYPKDGLEVSIVPYHRIKYVEIIYSKIIVYRNIHLHIDMYAFISKFINSDLFFSLQDAKTSDSHRPTTEEDVQEQKEDEKDKEEDCT